MTLSLRSQFSSLSSWFYSLSSWMILVVSSSFSIDGDSWNSYCVWCSWFTDFESRWISFSFSESLPWSYVTNCFILLISEFMNPVVSMSFLIDESLFSWDTDLEVTCPTALWNLLDRSCSGGGYLNGFCANCGLLEAQFYGYSFPAPYFPTGLALLAFGVKYPDEKGGAPTCSMEASGENNLER